MKPERWKPYLSEFGWLAYMLGLLLALLPDMGSSFEEMGDIALIARQVHMASEWDVLRGAYSRLGFFHIGPISFYWMALVDYILPSQWFAEYSHYYQSTIAVWVANAAMGMAALSSARKLGLSSFTRVLLLLFCIILIWHQGGHVLFSPWGPHLTILPVLWFAINLIRSGQGDFWALPGLAFSAIWILHSHAGSLIFLGPALIYLIYLWFELHKRGKLFQSSLVWPLVAGFMILTAGIAIPIYEAVLNDGGNLKAILIYLSENTTWRKPGKALIFMLSAMDGPFRIGFPLFSLLSLGLYLSIGRKTLGKTEKRLLALSLILIAGSFYGALRTPGMLVPHLFDHLLTINALILVINLSPLWHPERQWLSRLKKKLAPTTNSSAEEQESEFETSSWPVVFGVVALLGGLLLTGSLRDASAPSGNFRPSELLALLIEETDLESNPDAIYRIGLKKEHLAHWPGAAGLMLQMERRDLRACIDPPYQILFGPEALCPGRVNGTILIEPAPEKPKMKHGNAVLYRDIEVQFQTAPEQDGKNQ
ncbi:MAG: hypothetical protein CMF59_13300 [Leptospiraceae bacterium]|nr:hypothetical protein [Leptospiraceae bacterium]